MFDNLMELSDDAEALFGNTLRSLHCR